MSFRDALLLPTALLLGSCGGSPPDVVEPRPETATDTAELATPPVAEVGMATATYHGEEVGDPYQWLEDPNDAEVQAWSVASATLSNNLYFNGGVALPSDSTQALDPSGDDAAILADPRLGETTTAVPPVWDDASGTFADGSASICEVFEDLVRRYGVPHPLSPAIGAASSGGAAPDDIFGRPRSARTVGAAEALSP